jgi:hypothetical protein
VGFDDGLGDGKAHACTLYLIALVASAIELIEDQRLFEVVNSMAEIGHAGDYAVIAQLGWPIPRP